MTLPATIQNTISPTLTATHGETAPALYDPVLMSEKFDAAILSLETGMDMGLACREAFTTPHHLMDWVSRQADAPGRKAALLHALADGAESKSRELYDRMLERIDSGLLRNKWLADVEAAASRQRNEQALRYRKDAMFAMSALTSITTPSSVKRQPGDAASPPIRSWLANIESGEHEV